LAKLKFKFKRFLIAFPVVLWALLIAPAAQAQEIRVAFSNFPPLIGDFETGEKARPGLLLEIYDKVLKDLGYQPVFRQFPPSRIGMHMAKGEEIDLYVCSEFSRGQRPHYHYGPQFLTLTAVLVRSMETPTLKDPGALKDKVILKQRGFGGLTKLLDPSNEIKNANFYSIVPMFNRRRVDYIADFKERIEPLLDEAKGHPYSLHTLKTYGSYLCLNKRFDNYQKRLEEIHNSILEFQDLDAGKALAKKYKFSGRFGE